MLTKIVLIASLAGKSTVYGLPIDPHIQASNYLYCSTAARPLRYSESDVFVALDVSEYETGRVLCGDILVVYLDDQTLLARAWDAGLLYDADMGIVVDTPYKYHDRDSHAHVVNLSAVKRFQAEHKMERLAFK